MTLSDNADGCSSNQTEDRAFVIEVIGLRPTVESTNLKNPIRQSGRTVFKVPYTRMSREIRRIVLQGGQILSIRPLSAGDRRDNSSQKEADWWVKVTTHQPKHQFYFGPFWTPHEAESQQPGYVEDLREEGAEEITFEIWQGQPEQLTIANSA